MKPEDVSFSAGFCERSDTDETLTLRELWITWECNNDANQTIDMFVDIFQQLSKNYSNPGVVYYDLRNNNSNATSQNFMQRIPIGRMENGALVAAQIKEHFLDYDVHFHNLYACINA